MSYRHLTLLSILASISLFAAPERQRFAVYFGGAEADVANAVALDADGNAYVAGTMSRAGGRKTGFVAKTKADGTEVLWTSYLNGDSAAAVAVDARGAVWAGGNGFLAKLNGEDGRVERSLDTEAVDALAVDAAGAVYAAGDGWMAKYVGFDRAYALKLEGAARGLAVDGEGGAYIAYGQTLSRVTADGGFGYKLDLGWNVNAVAVDSMGAAYVTGANARLAKVTPAGDAVAFTVSLGGMLEQEGRGVALDGLGNVFVAGWTNSSDFARARGWHGDRDGFLVKLNAAGEVLDTVFAGTAARDALHGVAVTPAGDVFVAGWTEGAGLGSGPLAQLQGGTDGVMLKLASSADRAISTTTTALAISPSPTAAFGQAVVLTATVSPSGPTGKVTFYDGTSVVGVGTLSGSTASITTTALRAGSRSLRAYYGGDASYSASVSANVGLTVSVTPSLTLSPVGGTSTTVGSAPSTLAVGDFNGDNRADLAVVNPNSNSLSILLSNGAGGFTAAAGSPLTLGSGANSVAISDFNGDGRNDVVVANTNNNSLMIFLGNGSGGFSAAPGSPVNVVGGPFGVAAADVNGDGLVDLLSANFANATMSVLLGNGAGGFTAAPGSPVTVAGQPSFVITGDFNGDGKVDAAVTNFLGNNLSVFLGSGTGTFTSAGAPIATGGGPIGLETGDFNADGKTDLAVANFADTTISILLGNGTGGFTAGTAVSVGTSPRSVVALDYDGDGKTDLAVANYGAGTIAVLQGNGTGGFTAASGSPFGGLTNASGVAVGDFTGDGRVDVAVAVAGLNRVSTIPGVGAAPLVVSGTPANPTTTPQTISFLLRDADGYANISRVYFLFNTSPTIPTNTCHGFYDRADNKFYLYNDSLTVLQGPLVGGSGGTLSNSQCTVFGTGSGVSGGTGTDLTLNLRMGMLGTYATTTEKIYLWAVDSQGLGTGWVQTGSWVLGAPVPNVAPTVISGTPTNPTSSPQTFTFTVRDSNGAADIDRVYFLVNTTATVPVNSCHGFYDRASNGLYLYNDALTVLQGPLLLGSAGTLSNSQCSVNGLTSALVSGSGTDLVINLGMSLLGSYATATQNIYIWAVDKAALGTGWQKTGDWGTVTGPFPPTFVSGAPANPTGSPQTFTLVSRDPNGYADISRVYFVVNTSATVPVNSCHGMYDRATGAFYLYNDALTVLQGPLVPLTASTLSNSQCSINGALSSVSGSGTDLTVTLTMSLLGAYGAGTQRLYTWTVDNAGTGTGWQLASTWSPSVPAAAPTLVSTTPGSSTSATQTFTITGRDTNGFSDINRLYFQVHTSATVPANTCHGFYDRASNAVFLYDDSLTSLSAIFVGSGATIQNSQCRINGSGTTASGSGTDVVVNLNITRLGSYTTGAKSLFVWVIDNGSLGTGWLPAASWTL